nr:hypothetical protein [Tanacetum cinerariifolium]
MTLEVVYPAVHKIKAESTVNQVEAKRLIQKVKSLKKNDLLDMLVPRMLSWLCILIEKLLCLDWIFPHI